VTRRSTPGYIGPGLVIRGRLSGEGELQIDGRLEGDLLVQGAVQVGTAGVVLAAVEADRIVVSGHVRGHVAASDEVAVHEGGRIDGDVRAPKVAIDDGGMLHGGIDMEVDLPAELEET